jgi:hypothetical protein
MGMLIKERHLILKDYKMRNMVFDLLVLFSLLFGVFKNDNSIEAILIDLLINFKIVSFWKNKNILEEKFMID